MRTRCLCLTLLIISCAPGSAQDVAPLVAGETRTIPGSAGVDALVASVILPREYAEDDRRYPVMYILDPEWNLSHAASTAAFLAANVRMPEMIVVGVAAADRNRDFTPTAFTGPGGIPGSGGGPAFLRRLEEEVIPAIDAAYRTEPMRVLVGHSLGGLFASWAWTARPALFHSVVALDASMWWDDRAVAREILDRLSDGHVPRGMLVAAELDNPGGWARDSAALKRVVGGRAAFVAVADESHLSMPLVGLYHALRVTFADYIPEMRRDDAAVSAIALEEQYGDRLSRSWGYAVAPPLRAALEVVQRSLNRRDGAGAIRAAELAVRHYPNSASARTALVNAREQAPSLPQIPPPPASSPAPENAASLFAGEWKGVLFEEGGRSIPITLFIAHRGAGLAGHVVAHGLSFEGTDLRSTLLSVVVEGPELEWWIHNCCGGYIVARARLQADGSLVGAQAPRHVPVPPGMTLPDTRTTFRLERAANTGGSR